jgi:hypothetical protein
MSHVQRSNRAEVRNPVLALPAFKAVHDLPDPVKLALAALLDNLSKDAEAKAESSWLKKKGPIAAYWKAVAVYSKHASRSIRKTIRCPFPFIASPSQEATNENEDNSTRAA